MELGPFNSQYVLIDNSVKLLTLSHNETEAFFFAEYLHDPVVVTCQLYEDKRGTRKIGAVITEKETVLWEDGRYEAGRVRAIRCKGTPAAPAAAK